jgi:predicted metalloprotease with PDZ domain
VNVDAGAARGGARVRAGGEGVRVEGRTESRGGSRDNVSPRTFSDRAEPQTRFYRGDQGRDQFRDRATTRTDQARQRSDGGTTARARDNRASLDRLGVSFSQQGGRLSVGDVTAKGTGRNLGLRAGDQIMSVDGRRVSSREDLHNALMRATRDGDRDRRIPVTVWRDGRSEALFWTAFGLGLAGYGPWGWWGPYGYAYGPYGHGYGYDGYGYDGYGYGGYSQGYSNYHDNAQTAFLGVVLDPEIQDEAVVTRVYADSPAEDAGLRPGDVIESINGRPVDSPRDVTDMISSMEPGERATIRLGGEQPRRVETTLGAR